MIGSFRIDRSEDNISISLIHTYDESYENILKLYKFIECLDEGEFINYGILIKIKNDYIAIFPSFYKFSLTLLNDLFNIGSIIKIYEIDTSILMNGPYGGTFKVNEDESIEVISRYPRYRYDSEIYVSEKYGKVFFDKFGAVILLPMSMQKYLNIKDKIIEEFNLSKRSAYYTLRSPYEYYEDFNWRVTLRYIYL